MNKYFREKQTWKKEDIEKRSAHLADMALAIWPYFGDEKAEQTVHKKASPTPPKALYILGQHFAVQSWRDVLEQTMNIIADLEPEKFDQIVQQFPRFVGGNNKKFREMRRLKNGMFIEVNLSSQDIQRFCFQVLETIDLSAEDWRVETE